MRFRATLFSILSLVMTALAMPTLAGTIPAWADNQRHYAQVLNPIAAQVMHWADHQQIQANETIILKDADLQPAEDKHYRFELSSQHIGLQTNAEKNITFDFKQGQQSPIPQLEKTQIVSSKQNNKNVKPSQLQPQSQKKKQQLVYRARELAYWWLAHLDGNADAYKQAALTNWINSATYQSEKYPSANTQQAANAASLQSLGGHLLSNIKIKQISQSQNYILLLIVDWSGTLSNGKAGIARLEQSLHARLLEDGSFSIDRIIERTLLPDLQPWTKILC